MSAATRSNSTHIVFAGGGTGGHLIPGLATADELRAGQPNIRITFAGSGSTFERQHVAAAGYEYRGLSCRPLKRSPWAWPGFMASHLQGRRQALAFLRSHPADVIVGLGGYASIPMASVAALCGIPLVLVEQNAIPGRANRWLARHATRICLGLEAAARYFPTAAADRLTLTGTPIRKIEPAGVSSQPPLLVVCGGSGGARALNETIPRVFNQMGDALRGWRIVHQTGEAGFVPTKELYGKLGIRAEVVSFVDDLPRLFARASLVVCRSGGATLAELAAAGAPAILCPYPHAADDHQRKNADVLAAIGAATVIRAATVESETGTRELHAALCTLVVDPQRRQAMARAVRTRARPQAAAAVAQVVFDAVRSVAERA